MKCSICPRKCGAERNENFGTGICSVGEMAKIAKVMLHKWEEPCISGTNGSGAVFFSGCNLKCVYCQNYEISAENKGEYISRQYLREIFEELEEQGAHNINLVNPTHYAHIIKNVLEKPMNIPVIYNCGGYEGMDGLKMLEGKVQIYLVDMKYSDSTLSGKYSGAVDYPAIAQEAIKEMYRQVGDFVIDKNGIMQKGIIIRHLVLPGYMDNSKGVIDFVSREFKDKKIMFSLMGQYVPMGRVMKEEKFSEINKKVSKSMYNKLCEYMKACGIEYGFTQELTSADSKYTPDFQ